jgi:hypothetical protein
LKATSDLDQFAKKEQSMKEKMLRIEEDINEIKDKQKKQDGAINGAKKTVESLS